MLTSKSWFLSRSSAYAMSAVLAFPFLAAGGAISTAAAQSSLVSSNTLEQVVVTARYTRENIQTTPLAITALTGQELQDRGYNNITQVAASAPNVTMETAPAGFGKSAFISIRGIGQNDFKYSLEPGVGFYVDDVYFGSVFGSLFTLGDISRVEILRGPQGTLFGKNTEGGAVRIFTTQPTGGDHGYVEGGYGSFKREQFRGATDFTLIPDKLFMRVYASYLRSQGDMTVLDFACLHPNEAGNIKPTTHALGNPSGDCRVGTLGGENASHYRLSLRALPLPGLEINLSADLTDDRGQPPADKVLAINPDAFFLKGFNANVVVPFYGIPYDQRFITKNPYTTYFVTHDPVDGITVAADNTLYSYGLTATIDWQTPWNFHVKSITGYRGESGDFGAFYAGAPIVLVNLNTKLAHHQTSEEVQISGDAFHNSLEWVLGGYYYDGFGFQGGIGDLLEISLVQQLNDPETDVNKSVFAHAIYHITSKLSTELGIRYSDESKTYTYYRHLLYPYHGIPAGGFLFPITGSKLQYNRVDPKVGIQYQWTPNLMTYIQGATGYKAGGFNTRPTTAAQTTSFGPETLTAYEAGVKSEWFGHRLRANFDVFYSVYRGLQLGASGVDKNGNLANLMENVGKADIDGVEGEVDVTPIPGMLLSGNFGYVHFKYKNLGAAAGLSNGPSLSDVPPLTPTWKFGLSAQYSMPLGDNLGILTPRVDYTYQSKVFFSANNDPRTEQSGYGIANARLIWQSGDDKWTATLAVNNVFNKFYYTSLSNSYTSFGMIQGTPSLPRTAMITLRRSW